LIVNGIELEKGLKTDVSKDLHFIINQVHTGFVPEKTVYIICGVFSLGESPLNLFVRALPRYYLVKRQPIQW